MSENVKQNENRNQPAPAANTHVPKNAPMMKREIMEMMEQAGISNAKAPEVKGDSVKKTLLVFSNMNVYLGLKLVSTRDERTGILRDPVPRISMSFNGKFVDVPHNGKWWRAFADFCDKMADSMEGVDLTTSRVEDDVDFAKTVMSQFRTDQ